MNMDEHSTTLYWAAGASYDPSGSPLPDGYSLDPDFGQGGVFEDNDTDFRVIALKNDQGDYILAFAGTEGLTDAFADIQLGWNQWEDNRVKIRDYINNVLDQHENATFHFTGHSLGGALAQYAAYDYVQRSQQADGTTPEISLITFNGLSAVTGLTLYGGSYSPAVFTGVDNVRHYFVEGDFVSQLGGGHLGGNTYRIDNLLSDAPLNFLNGHFMSTIKAMTPAGFGMAEPAGIDYVNLPVLQPLAAGIATLLNDKDVTELEAGARVAAGVMGAISNYLMLSITPGSGIPAGELDLLVNVLFTNLAEAENGSLKGKALQAIADMPWERLTWNKSPEAGAVSVIAMLTGVVSDLYETTVDLANLLPEPEWLEQISQATELLNDFISANASSNADTLRGWFGDLANPVLAALGLNIAQPEISLSQLQLNEGGDGSLTLTLKETTDSTGQAYVVTVYDADLITLSGDGVYLRDAAAGEYLVIVKPGTNQTTIQVHAEMDLNNYDDDVLLQITGTPFSDLDDSLMDQPLGYGTIEVIDTDTPAGQTATLLGDRLWKDFDPDEPGIQSHDDALGNKINDPADIEVPNQSDNLYDSGGNDLIQAGGGEDVISAWRGGDDRIEAGAGRDKVYAGDGDDLIEGGGDTDILAGNAGNDRLYADEEIAPGDFLAGDTGQTANTRDWLSGGTGDDLLVGSHGDDGLAGGVGNDLILGGAGDDNIFGDSDYTAQAFDWTYTDSNNVRTFFPVAGVKNPPDGGADVIHAGTGNDHVWAGVGDDVVFGGAGNDKIQGQAGGDALMGDAGNDILLGDDSAGPQGRDYLDGGAGDDLLVGSGGQGTLYGGAGNDRYVSTALATVRSISMTLAPTCSS